MQESPPANLTVGIARDYGLIAEFDNVDAVVYAAGVVRSAGFEHFDVHSPFPIHGIDQAMGVRPTVLPWLVLAAGVTGLIGGLAMTIVTMATYFDWPMLPEALRGYRYLVSGKPLNSLPAWIPIIFECTILAASFAAVFGMLVMNKLPMLWHPLLTSDRFRRVTSDRFFVCVEARDAQYDADRLERLFNDLGAISVETIRE